MSAIGVAVQDLVVQLPDRRQIGPLSFALAPGECLGLVGQSGSGKTLLAQAILGLLPAGIAAQGRLHGFTAPRDLGNREHAQLRGAGIGYVFQDALASLHPLLTIGAQLAETLRVHGIARRDARGAVAAALQRVGLDPALAARYPHQLSGGQRQRVMIALALAPRPRLLLADEPSSALDALSQREILDLLNQLRRELGLCLVFIGHDLAVVAALADLLCVLRDGRVDALGPTAEVLAGPHSDYTRQLIAAQHPPRWVRNTHDAGELLRAEQISVCYPRRREPAVAVAELEVRRGEVLALVGGSGSGKSTLGRALLGLQAIAPGGRVRLAGQAFSTLDRAGWRQLRRRIQVVFQDPYASLDPRRRIRDILAEPLRIHRLPCDEARLVGLLGEVGLDAGALARLPHQFSGGQRQRIAIARALACDPELLICDEAVSALDALVRAQVLALLQRLRETRGLALLFITHDLALAEAIADRIMVLEGGRVVECAATEVLVAAPQHPYTRRLLAAR